MKTFSISYQLNNPYKDYTPFIEALKSYGNWWQVNQYNWIIGSENATATQINEHLRHFLFSTLICIPFLTSAWAETLRPPAVRVAATM